MTYSPNITYNTRSKVVTEITRPARVEALRQAAAETAGKVIVRTYDPSNTEERAAYALLVAAGDEARFDSPTNDASGPVRIRGVEEIDRDVIASAMRDGLELVAVESELPDLGVFYSRADEISAVSPEQS